jgi:hypothetical protein
VSVYATCAVAYVNMCVYILVCICTCYMCAHICLCLFTVQLLTKTTKGLIQNCWPHKSNTDCAIYDDNLDEDNKDDSSHNKDD